MALPMERPPYVKGFGCPAHRDGDRAVGPVSETLQGRNPRAVGAGVAAGAMGICASPGACSMRAEIGERGNGRCRSRRAVVASAVVASCCGVIEAPLPQP